MRREGATQECCFTASGSMQQAPEMHPDRIVSLILRARRAFGCGAAQRTSENQTLIIFGFGYLILNSMSECRMSRKRRVQPPSFQELP